MCALALVLVAALFPLGAAFQHAHLSVEAYGTPASADQRGCEDQYKEDQSCSDLNGPEEETCKRCQLNAKFRDLQAAIAELKDNDQLKATIPSLQAELRVLQEIKDLKAENPDLKAENQHLKAENRDLVGERADLECALKCTPPNGTHDEACSKKCMDKQSECRSKLDGKRFSDNTWQRCCHEADEFENMTAKEVSMSAKTLCHCKSVCDGREDENYEDCHVKCMEKEQKEGEEEDKEEEKEEEERDDEKKKEGEDEAAAEKAKKKADKAEAAAAEA